MIGAGGVTLEPGDSLALRINYHPQIQALTNLSIVSNNTDAVEIDGDIATAKAAGTANVTATAEYNGVTHSDTQELTVTELDYGLASSRTATGITLARVPASIEVGEEYAAQAYLLSEMNEAHPWPYWYSDDNLVRFTSSNPTVCRVKNGVLLGVAPGTVTITASDLDGNVSTTFDVEVVTETALEYTEAEVMKIKAEDYDWSTAETTTLAIIDIIAAASSAGMKKVVFPEQIYSVSPAYGTFTMPTQMILDFSGSVIQIEASDLSATGYQMFYFKDTQYSSVENAIIYGERELTDSWSYGCNAVGFYGNCYRSGLKNCTISNSPGFNISTDNAANMRRTGFPLSTVEVGGIDDNGRNIEEPYAYRNNGYIDISTHGSRIGFGNMQGFQGYLYLSARVYGIYFYDANKNFVSCLKNCIQYYRYPKPENAVYARIVFWQGSAPTSSDPDFGAIAHIYSYDAPDRCYLKNCVLENNRCTAIQPNGGENWLFDGCTFRDNGQTDPASHIDWEDGRNHNKGHVLRNCTFNSGGQIAVLGSDGVVIHNNVFEDVDFNIGSEAQNSRIWLNQFIGTAVSINSKTDMVFSQNVGWDGASYSKTENENANFRIRETRNAFE